MGDFFHSFDDVRQYLHRLDFFHMDMGLERMSRALAALHLEHPPFVAVQILGTNGKGSTAAFLASLAYTHGCRVGLYTSPHFVSPMERVRIYDAGGQPLPPDAAATQALWLAAANAIVAVSSDLTYFEFLTVLAVWIFTQQHVDLAIFEAGLGGRYDATSALAADLLCYASIAMDHQNVLGKSIAAIARDKAAAMRGAPVCSVAQYPEVTAVLAAAAREQGLSLEWSKSLGSGLESGLAGAHQKSNAGLALCAWKKLAPLLGKSAHDVQSQQQALRNAFVPGRLQRIAASRQHPPLVLDGAHNPHGMAALIAALRREGIQPGAAIFACLADKDWLSSFRMLKHFLGPAPIFVLTLSNRRATAAEDIVAACRHFPPLTAVAVAGGPEGLTAILHQACSMLGITAKTPMLLTGSLYLLAEFFTLFPQYLSSPPQER